MRPSLSLALLGLVGNFAYGFSSNTSPPPFLVVNPSRPLPLASAVKNAKQTSMTLSPSSVGRGGAVKAQATDNDDKFKASTVVASLWGTTGVAYILFKAIKRVLPIAMEPFAEGATPLSQFQLAAYVVTCVWFAYVEGYKGFQKKFSPLVVSRSLTLTPGTSPIHHLILAPFYSMGLFHATKKRMKISWGVTLGVAAIVAAVKRLAYPWRNVVDAGVVAGLTWGTASMLIGYIKALATGKTPADPALPKKD